MFRPSTSSVGSKGEEAAAVELKRLGYRIIERNFRAAGGEVDIIAEHKGVLVFVEVKARANERFGTPFDAVHPGKRRRIAAAAQAFMALRGVGERAARFDVAGVELSTDPPVVTVLRDAFSVGDWG